jgi:hypothetical protein
MGRRSSQAAISWSPLLPRARSHSTERLAPFVLGTSLLVRLVVGAALQPASPGRVAW